MTSRRDTGPDFSTRMVIAVRCGGRCERCNDDWAQDVHHRKPRGMGGTSDPRINLPSNLVALCRGCHDYIERNRVWALQEGWLVSMTRRARPETTPVNTGLHGRVLFDDIGGVTRVT